MATHFARSARADGSPRRAQWIRFNFTLAALTWAVWFVVGGSFARQSLIANWRVAVTMIFGSLVGGGTSEGGGAVAFPVFTKLLHIPAHQSCLFALAIQSVGMGAASLSILYLKIPIEQRVLLWGGLGGLCGIGFSTVFIEPYIAPTLVRIAFTVMASSLGVALILLNRKTNVRRHPDCPIFGARERLLLVLAGLIGGAISGLAGCGANIAVFMLMVLLFRVSEKVVTPTTVILMTIVAIGGFGLDALVIHDFDRTVTGYWLAAVPIVAVGAPLGAVICSKLSRLAIVNVLLVLIAAEFASTVLIVPMSGRVAIAAALCLLFFGSLNWIMSSMQLYAHAGAELEEPLSVSVGSSEKHP